MFGGQALLLLAAIGLLGTEIVRRVEDRYLHEIQQGLRTRAHTIAELVRDRPAADMPRLQERLAAQHEQFGARLTLLAADGQVLADTESDPAQMENHADRPEVQAARSAGFGTSARFSSTVQEPMMYGALRTADGQAVAYVRIALPLNEVQAELARLRGIVWTTAAGTALAALVFALWLARRVTR
jgi:two-component system phosphate regulon sensor histidine kinase PhoR